MAPLLYIQYFSEINFLKTYSDVKIGSIKASAIQKVEKGFKFFFQYF